MMIFVLFSWISQRKVVNLQKFHKFGSFLYDYSVFC